MHCLLGAFHFLSQHKVVSDEAEGQSGAGTVHKKKKRRLEEEEGRRSCLEHRAERRPRVGVEIGAVSRATGLCADEDNTSLWQLSPKTN